MAAADRASPTTPALAAAMPWRVGKALATQRCSGPKGGRVKKSRLVVREACASNSG